MIRPGDRVDVVLDVYSDPENYRVVMVGVFDPNDHKDIPPVEAGASRNIVQTWLGTPISSRAFRMGRGTE